MVKAKYSKHGIKKLQGEEYPFGDEGQENSSFAEMFDPKRFDRLEESYRRKAGQGQVAFSVQGYPPPQESLDLHGCTAEEAEKQVQILLASARRQGLKTVEIVTGKGLHSPGGKAVLPDVVEQFLLLAKKQGDIAGFRWEKRLKVKSGVVFVYL